MGISQQFYSAKNKKKPLNEKILEENLKTADQYEIAFLKGGDTLVFELAFYNLLKSGYLEKEVIGENLHEPSHLYQVVSSKDSTVLDAVEKETLAEFTKTNAWPSVLRSLYEKSIFLDTYKKKIFPLNLIYKRGRLFLGIRKLFNFCIIITSYLALGTNQDWFVRLCFIILTDIIVYRIVDRAILDRPLHVIERAKRKNIIGYQIQRYFLTNVGIKYIELFEKTQFPLPDLKSDKQIKEAYQVHRCSI